MRPVYLVEIEALIQGGMRVEPTHHIVTSLIGSGTADVILWSTHYTEDQRAELMEAFHALGWVIQDRARVLLRDGADLRTDSALKEFWLDNLDYFTRVRVHGAFETMNSSVGKMLSERDIPFVMAGFVTPKRKDLN